MEEHSFQSSNFDLFIFTESNQRSLHVGCRHNGDLRRVKSLLLERDQASVHARRLGAAKRDGSRASEWSNDTSWRPGRARRAAEYIGFRKVTTRWSTNWGYLTPVAARVAIACIDAAVTSIRGRTRRVVVTVIVPVFVSVFMLVSAATGRHRH